MLYVLAFSSSEEKIQDVLIRLEWAKREAGTPFAHFHNLHDGRCVKHAESPYLCLETARVMMSIGQNTTIPVPRVLLAFERDGIAYIVMEFVVANTLEHVRNQLTDRQQREVARQLADYARQIRGIPLANGTSTSFGNWRGDPYTNVYFQPSPCENDSVVPTTAFRTWREFNDYWVERSGRNGRGSNDSTPHPPVLAHGDLTCRNILMESGSARILAVVDWDTFGWYPDFWETMIMHRDAAWSSRWMTNLSTAVGAQTNVHEMYHDILDAIFLDKD
jgi:aminoglycoside phosphotransferase (APT) family kinase protein